ncbi:tRNA (adenosine(37)-N6)-threonylcarbamoyltransferase complex dimerization subunit type 1 TsaB [Hydrogenophaga sp. IBVHS1]|uniref:tRNA (adenosine(37)-N6)-threonylcarbamoyltransferase complex dimerization subunit type 1 TsaB n=1 Tax=unclassified Hydrogenophaga TaxID=2610897 RepID=UPI000A2D4487|nr:tRNA (adenosine(37)-N6)-threonylcarbamoyltransferase complex dimerization subunit type 1 TsaB [Hydrogenophaga sp. IBVHS1]OSZ73972.1 tRNA (adenosine(37)-N6)-threonylcarbamoyltransferase complex dimerization subunit type 1 TsaB [Hydrogenophaga sp. IBVHS1]
MPETTRLLAIETSTDTLSVALGSGAPGGAMWLHSGPGGAQASATLLPLVRDLLNQADWPLASLDAVVFGRGPGSFTGLRTACAVAQGLAYGARPGGIPVLPVDTLLALAEEARHATEQRGEPLPGHIVVLLDARMSELYVAPYALSADGLRALAPARLCAPADLAGYLDGVLPVGPIPLLVGNALHAYPDLLTSVRGAHASALPTASALLRLAPRLLAGGGGLAARDALPLYVRDKVAKTTAEREGQRTAVRNAEVTP